MNGAGTNTKINGAVKKITIRTFEVHLAVQIWRNGAGAYNILILHIRDAGAFNTLILHIRGAGAYNTLILHIKGAGAMILSSELSKIKS